MLDCKVALSAKPVDGPFFDALFFFQAEDGIRDLTVTGVQTCALPISTQETVRGIIRCLKDRDLLRAYVADVVAAQAGDPLAACLVPESAFRAADCFPEVKDRKSVV